MAVNDNAGKPEEHTVDGQTFYNAALTGSGTITPDGTYAEPLPDPTVARGGIKDGRTSPGGVHRSDPNEGRQIPEQLTRASTPATEGDVEAEQRSRTTAQSSKSRTQK